MFIKRVSKIFKWSHFWETPKYGFVNTQTYPTMIFGHVVLETEIFIEIKIYSENAIFIVVLLKVLYY